MAKMEVQIDNGKIFAPLKDKWLVMKPEEEVRQNFICKLVDEYGYSLGQMEQELNVTNSKRGTGQARADIVIWKSEKDRQDNKVAFIIIECKAENVTIKQEDYFQGCNYAYMTGADFFVTTNQKETRIFRVNKEILPKQLDEIVDIPHANEANNAKRLNELLTQTKSFTRDEFSKLLFKCHNIIRNNDKLSPEAAFDEISKILFIKIRHERDNAKSQIFSKEEFKRMEEVYNIYKSESDKPFYQNIFDKTKKDFEKDNLFENNECINIRETSFLQIVKELQVYNLSTTSDDVKGIAFEKFLGRTFRGELGQFFTPRTIVDFMVSVLDPKEGEYICDPCCGSGGFLIKAFEYVREQIENDIEKEKELIKLKYFDDAYLKMSDKDKENVDVLVSKKFSELNEHLNIRNEKGRLKTLSYDCIYGTDANPRMARTAKMNMIMHGDGHGGVHHHDGLLNVNGIWEGRFDVILTNPPFGAHIDESLKITENDRFTDQAKIKHYLERYGNEYRIAQKQIEENIGKSILSLYHVGKELNCGLTEVLFIERCLRLLRPGGRMGIVLPEGVLNTSNLQKVREYFTSIAKIILIVSLPQEVFLASGATVKTSLVFFKKFTEAEANEYARIKTEATKQVDAKYQDELDKIAKELAKTGRMNKEQKSEYESKVKEIKKKNQEYKKNLQSDFSKNKYDEFTGKYVDKLSELTAELKDKSITEERKNQINEERKAIKKLINEEIANKANMEANNQLALAMEPVEDFRRSIENDCPSKEERKKLELRKKEIEELKEREILEIIKDKFDYEIPISDIKQAGINSTGGVCDNDLLPLRDEFTEYRKANNLWLSRIVVPASKTEPVSEIINNTKVTIY